MVVGDQVVFLFGKVLGGGPCAQAADPYPFIETVDGQQILHTENFVIPLSGNTQWIICRHPKTGAMYIDDAAQDPSVKPRYLSVLEKRRSAIPRDEPFVKNRFGILYNILTLQYMIFRSFSGMNMNVPNVELAKCLYEVLNKALQPLARPYLYRV